MIDQKTINREYPLPHPDNMLEEDVDRIKDSLEKIDVDINDLYGTTTLSVVDAQSGTYWYAVSTGTGAAYEINLNPAPTALNNGKFIHMKAHIKNSGPATVKVNSLDPKNVKRIDGSDLKPGDIPTDGLITLIYDGINFQLANSSMDKEQTGINTSNVMRVFEEIQENHGGSLLMEAGWSDSFEIANEQGADESNSSSFQHDNINKLYKGTDPGLGLTSDKNYNAESNFLQQEWTNSLPATGQATVTNGDTTVTLLSGSWPSNCETGRISFDSGSTWYVIDTRTDATNIELTTTATESTGSYNYTIRLSEFDSGLAKLNVGVPATGIDSNTVILVHGDSDFSDSSTAINKGTGAAVGSNPPEINTSIKKFGAGSMRWPTGNNENHITFANNSDFRLTPNSTSDLFTIDFWIYLASPISANNAICSMGVSSASYYSLQFDSATLFVLECYDNLGDGPGYSNENFTITALNTGQWYHMALIKGWGGDSTKVALTIDGVANGTVNTWSTNFYTPTTPDGTFYLGKGAYTTNRALKNVYLDEFRISNTARWTANFTPPTTAYAAGTNANSEYVSICDIESQKTNTFSWSDINSGSATEALESQNAYYWLTFDPVSNFGDGTEIKIFNPTGAIWRKIARNSGGTWEYNNDATDTAAETWTAALINNMLHAVSQAVSTQTANRMTGTNLATITDAQWEESGGWSNSVNAVVRGLTLYSNNSSQNPSVSQYSLNYDSERESMDLRSKAYDPDFTPSDAYVWANLEHTDVDGPGDFYVSRNGGSDWTSISMVQQGLPLSGDRRILRGTADLSGQASGQDLRCRYQTSQGKDQFLHSWGLQAKS